MILKIMESDLVDTIWEDKPKSSACDIFVHESWAGTSAADKIKFVQKAIAEKNGNGCIFADLSTICWVLNVRSDEIPYNPFMKAILLISPADKGPHTLYLPTHHPHHSAHSEELKAHLAGLNVEVKSYPWTPFPDKVLCSKD